MATQASLGYGAKLKRGNGSSPESFVDVPEVRSISGLGVKKGLKNVTNLDSANSSMEYIGTLKDGAEIQVKVNYLPQNSIQNAMMADADVSSARNYKLQMPTGMGTFNFAVVNLGYVADEVTPESELTGTFTLKISGPVTWQNLP